MLVYLGLEIADSADKEATVNKKGTILLLSGELDKAVAAFIIATGFAALGVEMKMSDLLTSRVLQKVTVVR